MSVELKVPEVGESVTEVFIGKWYKAEGDAVEQDEPLVEIESDKATVDVRAPAAGVLAKILKNTGDEAEVGEAIGRIEENGKAAPRAQAVAARDKAGEAETEQGTASTDGREAAVKQREEPQPRETVAVESEEKARVKKEEADEPTRSKESREQPTTAERRPAEVESAVQPSRGEERAPMSVLRRRIAARLVEAQQNAALLTTFNEIDMTAVKQLRARFGEPFERRHQIRLGFMSFFVKASIAALRQFPELNALIDDDEIVYRHYHDIGVAISTDRGLVVPVLRNADQMTFAQIEKAIDDFANRARRGELKVEELQGGTFTITNGGVFGSLLSTPIVNPPQSGVLGMHAIQDRPVAINNDVVIRPMMYVALTYDHRIVDGREAVTFLRRIKETIEAPARLLIDV